MGTNMEGRRARQVFWCLLILLGVNVTQIVVYTLVHLCTGGRLENENIWISLISAVINGGICLLVYGKLHGKEPASGASGDENILWKYVRNILRWLVILVGGCAFCVVVTFGLTAIETLFPQWFTSYNAAMEKMDIRTSLVTIFYALLIAPIAEECIFRGALFSALSQESGFWFANTVQAFCFGLYHGNPIQGVYAFLMGIILGYVYRYGKGLAASIWFHVAFNGTTWMMNRVLPAEMAVTWQMFAIVIPVGGILCVCALWMLQRMHGKGGGAA